MCWPIVGAGTLRPLTLPSQVKTCSSASSSRQQRDEHARRGQVRRDRRGERGQHRRGQRRQRGLVDRHALVVERRLHHLQAQQAVALEPLGHDRDDVAAGLRAGADGLDERLALFLRGRLEERVDPALAVDQPLGLEADDQDRRLRMFRLVPVEA